MFCSGHETLLRPFALFFFTFCLFALVSDAFIAIGQVRALFIFDVISTLLIVSLLVNLEDITLSTMAWARGWLAVITTLALMAVLQRRTAYNIWRLGALSLLVVVPSLLAGAITEAVHPWLMPSLPLLALTLTALMFGLLASGLLLVTPLLARRHSEEITKLWDQG